MPTKQKTHIMAWSIVKPILLVSAITFILYLTARPAVVFGQSMEPTLHEGDVCVLSRLVRPKPGDIVVVRIPGETQNFVKRVEHIEPNGQIYLLGDNRDNSYDSRNFGAVDSDCVIGTSVATLYHCEWLSKVYYIKSYLYHVVLGCDIGHDRIDCGGLCEFHVKTWM